MPLNDITEPATVYLDESEPALKIPIWRACAATRTTDEGAWMPAAMGQVESEADKEKEARSAEEDEALTQLFKASMKEVPWVKAAMRAGKRKGKAEKKKAAVEETGKEV